MSKVVLAAVIAYHDAVKKSGGTEPRMQLETAHAISLAKHLSDNGVHFRHQAKVAGAVSNWLAFTDPEREAPPRGSDADIKEGVLLNLIAEQFWDAFEGEVVEGVEILRKRA